MKQSDNRFEEMFSKRYDGLELEMDGVDILWDRIAHEPKKKRRPFFWLLMGFGLLISGVLFSNYIISKGEIIKPSVVSNVANVDQKIEIELVPKDGEQMVVNQSISESSKNEILISKDGLESNLLKPSITTSTLINNKAITLSKENANTPKFKLKSHQKNESAKNTLVPLAAAERHNIQPIENIPNLNRLLQNQYFVLPTIKGGEEINLNIVDLSRSSFRYFYLRSDLIISRPIERVKVIDQTAMIGSELTSEVYKSLRKQYFIPVVSYGLKLSGGISFNDKIDILVGLEYQVDKTQFQDNSVQGQRILEQNPNAFFIKSNDNSTDWIGAQTYGTKLFNVTNYEAVEESYLNLPIGMAYSFFQKRKWALSLRGGVNIGLRHSYNGRILTDDLVLEHKNGPIGLGHLRNRISYTGGFDLKYQAGQRSHLVLSSQFRVDPRNSYSQLVTISKIYSGASIGFQIGL